MPVNLFPLPSLLPSLLEFFIISYNLYLYQAEEETFDNGF